MTVKFAVFFDCGFCIALKHRRLEKLRNFSFFTYKNSFRRKYSILRELASPDFNTSSVTEC